MSTILLTGANGFVGSHVLPALLAAGHDVVALVRDDDGATDILARIAPRDDDRVHIRTGDVTQPDTLPAALEGCDVVVHLVAIPRDFNGGRDLHKVNTEGTANIVAAAKAAGVHRFVHQSALGVEEDPDLQYADSKAKGERIVRASGLDWTILKPSLMWGEGDGFFSLLAGLARWSPGIVPVPGMGRSRFQPLWVGDLARIVVEVLATNQTIGHSYELGGPAYWTYRDILKEVLAGIGAQRLIVPMPVPLISLVAGAAEAVHLPFPVATDQLRQLRLDNIGPLHGVEHAFGFKPRPMNGRLGYLGRRGRPRPTNAPTAPPSTAEAAQ